MNQRSSLSGKEELFASRKEKMKYFKNGVLLERKCMCVGAK